MARLHTILTVFVLSNSRGTQGFKSGPASRHSLRIRAAVGLDPEIDGPLPGSTSDTRVTVHTRSAATKKFTAREFDAKIFAVGLPATFGALVDPVLSLVDTAWVGRLGKESLAALGPCCQVRSPCHTTTNPSIHPSIHPSI